MRAGKSKKGYYVALGSNGNIELGRVGDPPVRSIVLKKNEFRKRNRLKIKGHNRLLKIYLNDLLKIEIDLNLLWVGENVSTYEMKYLGKTIGSYMHHDIRF